MNHEEFAESIVDSIVTLPTIPTVLAELNGAIANPNSSAADIAAIISRDPPTATKALRLANSAYYGLRNKVTTVNHAITMLGFNIVRNLVLTATVFDMSSRSRSEGLFDKEHFWQHSLAVGVLSRIVGREAFPQAARRGDEFFVCGLLHDLGKIILDQHLNSKFEQALKVSRERKVPLIEAEREVITCTHAEVGSLLAKRWNLSAEITYSLGFHHDPLKAPEEQYRFTLTVHLADVIARRMSIGSDGGGNPPLNRTAWEALGLSKRKVPSIIMEAVKSLEQQELAF
ncbi:MAG: HDOD domain-containing protein [Candidatus Abyssubacteria bacterium]